MSSLHCAYFKDGLWDTSESLLSPRTGTARQCSSRRRRRDSPTRPVPRRPRQRRSCRRRRSRPFPENGFPENGFPGKYLLLLPGGICRPIAVRGASSRPRRSAKEQWNKRRSGGGVWQRQPNRKWMK